MQQTCIPDDLTIMQEVWQVCTRVASAQQSVRLPEAFRAVSSLSDLVFKTKVVGRLKGARVGGQP